MSKARRRIYSRRPFLKKRKNGIYYIYHQHQGRQVRQSTRTRKRLEAEASLDQYLRSLAGGQSVVSAKMTIHQGITEWLEDRQSPRWGLKKSTLCGYQTFAKKLTHALPPRLLVRHFSRSEVRKALDRLHAQGESQIQVAKCGTVLTQVCNFLVVEEHLAHNPCTKVFQAPQYQTPPALAESEYLGILEAMKGECDRLRSGSPQERSRQDLRDLVELCWHTGLRFVELTRLQWADIDWEHRTIATHAPRNKGGERVRPLTGSAFRVLENRRKEVGPVFPGTYARMMTAWGRFRTRHPEFSGARFHGMRRAFVTRIHGELGPAAAMVLAGHKSPDMTGLYTDPGKLDWGEELETM